MSDSLEELEDALKRFDEDMNEDVFDSSTYQTRAKQDVQVTTFKEIVPSQDATPEKNAATLTGQEKAKADTASADTITPLQEQSSSDVSTQETPKENLTEMGSDTEAQEVAIPMDFQTSSSEMDTQLVTTSTYIGFHTVSSDPSVIEVGTQTESKKVSKDISTQTEPLEDQDLDDTSFPLLNLSEYLTAIDDPYVQRQHRIMKQVEDNKASLKRLHENVDKIETLLKKIVHQPKEGEPFNSDGIQQPISAAARSDAASVCASAENILAPSRWTSTPKRSQTPAKIITSSFFSRMDTPVEKPFKSSESATSQKLPKSIFSCIESLASSSSSSTTQVSSSKATIQIAKSIFRSVDSLAASDCPASTNLLYMDKSANIAEEKLVVKQQRKPVSSIDFLKMQEEDSLDVLNSDDDRYMEIGDMDCDELNMRNSEY